MSVVTLGAACAVLAVVALTAAATAPALLDGALRARTLAPRLGAWLVVAGTVVGALTGPDLARRVAATLSAPSEVLGGADGGALGVPGGLSSGAFTVGVAALVVVVAGAVVRGVARPGTTAVLLVCAAIAAVWRSAGSGLVLVVLPAVLGPAVAAAGALALVVALAWALRHATPEPVHRRSRALAVLSTALLAVGAGTQTGQVGVGLVLLVTGESAELVGSGAASTLPVGPRLLVAAVVGLSAAAALLRPHPVQRPLRRREPPVVLVADSCAAVALLAAAAAGLPVPVLLVLLAARAGADLPRGLRAVEWRALVRR